jgi:opacity protein-like surface antigen
MKRVSVILALAVLCALPVVAQDKYKAEVFGGYQYSRLSSTNFNGWNGSITGNVNSWFGVTADMSGAYKSESGLSLHEHNFLFGPTISYNKAEHFKPFVHALFGVSHANAAFAGVGASDNALATALGGGVDAGITRHVAIRLFQADYFMTRFASDTQNNSRISTGLVFRF